MVNGQTSLAFLSLTVLTDHSTAIADVHTCLVRSAEFSKSMQCTYKVLVVWERCCLFTGLPIGLMVTLEYHVTSILCIMSSMTARKSPFVSLHDSNLLIT